jgi:SAM-dependent methyltransferase
MLDDARLEASSVVANNAMNRERGLMGVNSYERELGFDPATVARGAWLDLCCGSGRALIQATRPGLTLVGVDLVDYFAPHDPTAVTLVAAPLRTWAPDRAFDLITCVHGLHYVGDKLGTLERAVRWLAPDGRLYAHLDVNNVKGVDVRGALRRAGVHYDARRRLVVCDGRRALDFGFTYLGADDQAGPNATGQPAVDSYYAASVELSITKR